MTCIETIDQNSMINHICFCVFYSTVSSIVRYTVKRNLELKKSRNGKITKFNKKKSILRLKLMVEWGETLQVCVWRMSGSDLESHLYNVDS